MAHTEKCSVCYGSGKTKGSFTWHSNKQEMLANLEPNKNEQVCYGCEGKGCVEVSDGVFEGRQFGYWPKESKLYMNLDRRMIG